MDTKNVSVLGCGWLGLPLAKKLIEDGFFVKGSTTQHEKISILREARIEPYLISFDQNLSALLKGKSASSFFNSDILFLNIPFRRNLPVPEIYFNQINAVVNLVEGSSIKHVIFAGSTSIYQNRSGEISEDDQFEPDNDRSKVLKKVEQMLMGNAHFQSTILRFAGLYGGARQIGQFLSGIKGLTDGNSPVNLVHLDDCVRIVSALIKRNIIGEIFNICSDKHPSKEELYTKAAKKLGVPLPTFEHTKQQSYKIVSNQKIKEALNYTFKYPNPLLGL